VLKVKVELDELAVGNVADEAVNAGQALGAGAASALDNAGLHDVEAALLDVELDQAAVAGVLVGDGGPLLVVEALHVVPSMASNGRHHLGGFGPRQGGRPLCGTRLVV
jgi:hypothetical protein